VSRQSRQKSRRHKKSKPPSEGHSSPQTASLIPNRYVPRDHAPRNVSNLAAERRTTDEWAGLVSRVQDSARWRELGLEARHIPGKHDVGVYDTNNHRVATVQDNRALVEPRSKVSGTFLSASGDHWDQLYRLLAERNRPTVAHDEFTPIQDEELTAILCASARTVERATLASRVIWDRFQGFGQSIQLPGDEFTTRRSGR
jgi:hypothetical protein